MELGIDDDLQRLEDLVSRGHAHIVAGPRYAAASGAAAAEARRSIAARRASERSLGVEPERGRDLLLGDAVGEHAEDRQVVRLEPLADRAQRARVQRRPQPAAQHGEQRARRRRLGQHRVGARDRGAHGEAGVGERASR